MRRINLLVAVVAFFLVRAASAERVLSEPTIEAAASAAGCVVDVDLIDTWRERSKESGDVELWHARVRGVIAEHSPTLPPATTRPITPSAGDSISVAGITSRYRLSPDLTGQKAPRTLTSGDRVIAFLSFKEDRYNGFAAFGETSAEWVVPHNSLWYVDGEKVYAFAQYWGERWWAPGAARIGSVTITKTPANYPRIEIETLAGLRERVKTALRGTR